MIEDANPAGVVLAGGSSTRMGADKALLELGGVRFIVIVCRAMERVCERVFVAAGAEGRPGRRDLESLGMPLLPDPPGMAGPAAGLLAGLRAAGGGWVLAATCDAPLVPAGALRVLRAAGRGRPVRSAVVFHGDGRDQPFPGLYGPGVREAIEEEAREGRGAMTGVLERLESVLRLEPPCDARLLADVDDPGDYRDMAARFPGSR